MGELPQQPSPHRPGAKRWLLPVLMLAAVFAITCGAILVHVVSRKQVRLDDGTVWVTSQADQKAARYNVRLREANAAVSAQSANFDVAQHDDVMLLSEQQRTASVEQSSVTISDGVRTNASMRAYAGAGIAVIFDSSTGKVWVGDSDDVAAISPAGTDPNMDLGAGGMVAVAHDGTVFGFDGRNAKVHRLDGSSTSPKEVCTLNHGERVHADSFTVIDGEPVISSGNTVFYGDTSVAVDGVDTLILQEPPSDGEQHGWVAASADGVFVSLKLDGSATPRVHDTGGTGAATAPVSVNGCVHAVWAQSARNYLHTCSAQESALFQDLQSVASTSDLRLRVNHRQVVVNDVANGDIWDPASSTEVIRIQWHALDTDANESESEQHDSTSARHEFAQHCSLDSASIRAVNDEFSMRVGAHMVLDPLRNDEQSDCSVLRIAAIRGVDDGLIAVASIYDGRFLQVNAIKAGRATFTYEITDGHGQSSYATVVVTVSDDSRNRSPEQTEKPESIDVEQGAIYTVNALGGFTDPDGDPLTLTGAVVANTDAATVSTRADGRLVFNAGSMTQGRAIVNVSVSDGMSVGEGTIYFTVRPANTLSVSIDPVSRTAVPNTPITVYLSDAVHATSMNAPQLTQVDAPERTSATMLSTDLAFTFQATDAGTYLVPYTVEQGSVAATGLVRIDVQAQQQEKAAPIAVTEAALLSADGTAIVEPLGNDIDPMGGVLSVRTVQTPADSGIAVGIAANKRVYITARSLPDSPVSLTYAVANEMGASTGTIVVQPPVTFSNSSVLRAGDINASVRTGGIVSVSVLDHITPKGDTAVALDSELLTDAQAFSGLAFVSADAVRYQAPSVEGDFPLTYTVTDASGNQASGTITFHVHTSSAETKAAPRPADVEAQVAAGRTIRIPIALTGIDDDGDDIQLLGLGNTAPSLGRVTETGADYLLYEAYADSAGTDTFSYAVEDWTGRRAQAHVRVGIVGNAASSTVLARDDAVSLRPNTAVSIPVLLNDISSDGDELALSSDLECQGIEHAEVHGSAIVLTAPAQAGTAYVVYTARNAAGICDHALLKVSVDPDAPIQPPIAYDYRVPASATIDKRTVNVDVAEWIANPSGNSDELSVSVDPSAADHARVIGRSTLSIDLTDETQFIPYTVSNVKHHVSSTAFIQVPAYGVFAPMLRPKAPELRVHAGESITIPIADYVRVGAGKTPRIDRGESVSATKSADSDHIVDDSTVRFTAVKDYSGPASITFTVADGIRGSQRIVNSAVLTLPITVVGSTNAAPMFSSTSIDVAAGETVTIDVNALLHADSTGNASYRFFGGTASTPFTSSLSESGILTVVADATATAGVTQSIPLSVDYGNGVVQAGVTVRTVASTRPLARIQERTAPLKPGESTDLHVLDGAYNPFDAPLNIVSAAGDYPSELSVRVDGDIVHVTAATGAAAITHHLTVVVQDATENEHRRARATFTIPIQDVPEPPLLLPTAVEAQDEAVTLGWMPGDANGSPISEYQVLWNGGDSHGEQSCGIATNCRVTGLTNGITYSLAVKARNAIGWSQDSASVTAKPDRMPTAPRNVQVAGGYRTLTVTWSEPAYEGSRPTSYVVHASASNGWSGTTTVEQALSATIDVPNASISDSARFTATVAARNELGEGEASATAETRDVWGDPDPPTVLITQNGDHVDGIVTLGDMRNAGCATVTLSDGEASCSALEFSVPIEKYFADVQVRATVKARKQPSHEANGVSNTITLNATIAVPNATVRVESGNKCVASWSVGEGKADGVHLRFGSAEPQDQSVSGTASVTLNPWQSCPTAEVTAHFQGHMGEPVRATYAYQYRVNPVIDESKVHVSRSATNSNALVMHAEADAFETYGQEAAISVMLSDGRAIDWKPNADIPMSNLKDGTRWRVQVCFTADPNYRSVTEWHTIEPASIRVSPSSVWLDSQRNPSVTAVPAMTPAHAAISPQIVRSTYDQR